MRRRALPLPLDALAAAAAVWGGLALFCAFSLRGAAEYERLAVLMKYQDDPVLRALFMAHKVATGFAAALTLLATVAALLARHHHAASHAPADRAARRRLMAACAAAVYVAEFFAVVMAAACAASWGVGHTVQLGIDATASGDNADFNAAVSEALAQAQTKLSARTAASTEAAYASLVSSGIGSVLAAPAAKFRDSVLKMVNSTAAAAVTRANASMTDPPPPRPASCANKFCVYLPLRPLFEEGNGLCVCTFEYLARAAGEAGSARGDVLVAFVGALMMCGGFGALLQRITYWLGSTSPAAVAVAAAAGAGGGGPPPPPPLLRLSVKAGTALPPPPARTLSLSATAATGDDGGQPASPGAGALGRAEGGGRAGAGGRRRWWSRGQ